MKHNYTRYPVCSLVAALWVALIFSCKKNEDVIKTTPADITAADSLKAYPGMNSMTLSWEVKDKDIKRAVAYCDNGDSVEVIYDGASTMTATFTGLEDGNYSFSVYLYDAQGNPSNRAKIVTRVYGDRYIQSLTSRQVQGAIFKNDSVFIAWQSPESNGLGTEINYLSIAGDTQQVFLGRNNDSTVLPNYKPGTYFRYRTMFKPVPEAIDTFYASYSSAEDFSTFTNPLFANKGADPWVAYKDGVYYFTYTQGGGITLYATAKMSQLGSSEPVEVWRPPAGTNYSKDLWAPELHYIDGKWYVYFAADNGQDINHRMYVIENSSEDPMEKTWVFKGELQEPSNNWAIDGTPLEYNGQLYFIWSGKTGSGSTQSLYIAKMSNPYTLEGERIAISTPEYSWEKNGSPINEGPEILKNKEGSVFLIYSGSGFWTDDYCLGMLTLRAGGDPMNPSDWIKNSQPVFKSDAASGAYAPGHNGFFKSRDGSQHWIIYHARSLPNGGSTNYRNPRIQQFTWNADGTPNFGNPVKINERIMAPSGEF